MQVENDKGGKENRELETKSDVQINKPRRPHLLDPTSADSIPTSLILLKLFCGSLFFLRRFSVF